MPRSIAVARPTARSGRLIGLLLLVSLELLIVALLVSCPEPRAPRSTLSVDRQREAAKVALEALQAGRFYEAEQAAGDVLTKDPGNVHARLVRAISRYAHTWHDFVPDLFRFIEGWYRGRSREEREGGLHKKLAWMEKQLGRVEEDLAVAAAEPNVSLRLCLACWTRDWNHNGRIDRADRLIFQIELDADGNEIPEGDPRRKPTFRFDRGDVYWARAFVAFQRAILNLVVAYELPTPDDLKAGARGRGAITIKLRSKRRVRRARELILAGLDHADRCRREYLLETDDEAEWVPNPRQKNHPMPLPVDQALYDTWEGVVRDLKALMQGQEGLDIAELAQLGDHQWPDPPRGFLHVGRLFDRPGDIVIDLEGMKRDKLKSSAGIEKFLAETLGDKYVRKMRPTPLVKRLRRMKGEVGRGKESLNRKLRYFLWLN